MVRIKKYLRYTERIEALSLCQAKVLPVTYCNIIDLWPKWKNARDLPSSMVPWSSYCVEKKPNAIFAVRFVTEVKEKGVCTWYKS